jgi:hypothetical protein
MAETTDFEKASAAGKSNVLTQFLELMARNKKWWLLPIVVVFVVFGVLFALAGTAAAPFIYALF